MQSRQTARPQCAHIATASLAECLKHFIRVIRFYARTARRGNLGADKSDKSAQNAKDDYFNTENPNSEIGMMKIFHRVSEFVANGSKSLQPNAPGLALTGY